MEFEGFSSSRQYEYSCEPGCKDTLCVAQSAKRNTFFRTEQGFKETISKKVFMGLYTNDIESLILRDKPPIIPEPKFQDFSFRFGAEGLGGGIWNEALKA